MLNDETKREATVAAALKGEPIATKDAPLFELEGIPVIAADDVGLYVSALEAGTEMSDVVASMAPPFDRFFIEFQRVPNLLGLHAWGAQFTAVSDKAEIAETHPRKNDSRYPRWVYVTQTYLEKRKGEPFGPASIHLCGLADDGSWFRHSDGALYWEGALPSMSCEPPKEVREDWDMSAALSRPDDALLYALQERHPRRDYAFGKTVSSSPQASRTAAPDLRRATD